MILRDKKEEDISYTDLKELAKDIAFAQITIENLEMSNKDFNIFCKAIAKKQKELHYYIDRACLSHQGAGKFYPFGYAVLVDSLEEDNKRIRALDSTLGPIYYSPDMPYRFNTNYEREIYAWFVLKDAIFDYGVKHGYLQLGPRERVNKEVLRDIQDCFGSINDDRIKIVGRDFSEEELDAYLKDTQYMSR